jgi:hypothetical protein
MGTLCWVFSSWRWGGSDPSVDACFYASILRISQMIWVWRATVEWYIDGKTEELGEKSVPVPLCPPQIPHGLTRARTLASVVRGWRLTTWAYYVDLVECLVVWLQDRVNWDVVRQLCVWMCVDIHYTAAPSVSTGIDAHYLHIWADSYSLINWILRCHWRTSMCKSSRCYIFLNILIVKRIADFSILISTLLSTWMLTLGSETLPKDTCSM